MLELIATGTRMGSR